jgi:hypothetical protein
MYINCMLHALYLDVSGETDIRVPCDPRGLVSFFCTKCIMSRARPECCDQRKLLLVAECDVRVMRGFMSERAAVKYNFGWDVKHEI